mgnify:CR=1 FL=1|jgi:uncharacterized protein with FMN-binding domain|tara:strand:+ start:106 stop:297 length:192 start_codon:yes stop_codon:yes gene_type:complete
MKFTGKIIRTSAGNMKIKTATYTGIATGSNMEVIKKMSVTTQCGRIFNISERDLIEALLEESQ